MTTELVALLALALALVMLVVFFVVERAAHHSRCAHIAALQAYIEQLKACQRQLDEAAP